MTTPKPDLELEERERSMGEFVRAHWHEILAEWQHLVRELPAAAKLDRPALLDHVPDVLERVAELVDEIWTGKSPDLPRDIAERHALDRLGEGFDLPEVVLEYSILRDCILRCMQAHYREASLLHGVSVLNRAIDRAVAASVDRYTYARDRTLTALDRISTVALESSNLDELLNGLLIALVQTTAAADTAII